MKTVYSLLYGMLFLLCACGQSGEGDEYDSVRTTVYTNSYDANGRLSEVVVKARSRYLDKLGYFWGPVHEIVRKYSYPETGTCIITETSDLSSDEISTTIIGNTFEKHYTLKNNDTTVIRMYTYTDATKSKPLMEREKYRFSGFPIDDYEENVNTETRYYYDGDGKQTKIIKTDFNSGEIIETYRADKNASHCEKQYVDNGKTIKITFTENQKLQTKNTKYTADGLDIEIIESVYDGVVFIDSIYYREGKEVRHVHIHSGDKSITTSEYDEKGNIVLEIEKTKSDIKISDEELKEMFQRYKDGPKTKN